MSEEDAFIRAILTAPGDATPRLVYADWLEERGDPRSEYLRLAFAHRALNAAPPSDVARARRRQLRKQIDPRWVARMHGRWPGQFGKPESGTRYVFVRVEAGTIQYGFFTRWDDSSLYMVPESRECPDTMVLCGERNPDEWRSLLSELSK